MPPAEPPDTTEDAVEKALSRVRERFERQLDSDLPPVAALCAHIERFRGKMLRPRLVILSALAANPGRAAEPAHPDTITCAAVCEMVHMATLVHDDVLDEADSRRGGATINALRGNEAAVLLGDYLIASAYHLCSQMDSRWYALLVGEASRTLCAGELLQLHHQSDFWLDEATYFEIVTRKTAALVALSCRLGAMSAGADERVCENLAAYGRAVGIAFQIQDDLLDLEGDETVLGKPVRQDLRKGKLTLPLIHHLASVTPMERGASLELLEAACGRAAAAPRAARLGGDAARRELARRLAQSGSIAYARAQAARLVDEARQCVRLVPGSPARDTLDHAAFAAMRRLA